MLNNLNKLNTIFVVNIFKNFLDSSEKTFFKNYFLFRYTMGRLREQADDCIKTPKIEEKLRDVLAGLLRAKKIIGPEREPKTLPISDDECIFFIVSFKADLQCKLAVQTACLLWEHLTLSCCNYEAR